MGRGVAQSEAAPHGSKKRRTAVPPFPSLGEELAKITKSGGSPTKSIFVEPVNKRVATTGGAERLRGHSFLRREGGVPGGD